MRFWKPMIHAIIYTALARDRDQGDLFVTSLYGTPRRFFLLTWAFSHMRLQKFIGSAVVNRSIVKNALWNYVLFTIRTRDDEPILELARRSLCDMDWVVLLAKFLAAWSTYDR